MAFTTGLNISKKSVIEQTDLCYDTAKYLAWVGKKGKEYRCFMEQKEYPHRVRASPILLEEDNAIEK